MNGNWVRVEDTYHTIEVRESADELVFEIDSRAVYLSEMEARQVKAVIENWLERRNGLH